MFELEQPNVKTKKQFEVEISSSDNQKLNDLRSDLVNSQQLVDDLSSQLEEERARSKELKLLFAQQRSEVEEELEECQNRISVLNLQIVEERKKVESQGKKIQLLEQMIASKAN